MITSFFGRHSFGGDSVYIERLSRALLRRGHEVRVVYSSGAFELARGSQPQRNYEAPPELFIHDIGAGIRGKIAALWNHHTGVPSPGWAQAVCEAFREDPEADAISYSFTNGSPDTYFYRSVFMAEYGALAHPLREGMAPAMAANNVAYRRDTLRKMSDALDSLLEIDYFLQKALGRGFRTVSAPRALLAHQTNRHLGDLLRGHFIYAQLFALRRLQFENWSLPKRLAGAAAVPVLVPLLRIKRLFQAVSGGPNVSRTMAALPVILLLYVPARLARPGACCTDRRISKSGSSGWNWHRREFRDD